jgi:hypothetical protein
MHRASIRKWRSVLPGTALRLRLAERRHHCRVSVSRRLVDRRPPAAVSILPRPTWVCARVKKHSHNCSMALLGSDEEWRRTLAMVAVCVGPIAQQSGHYRRMAFPCCNIQRCGAIVRYPIDRCTRREQLIKHVHVSLLRRSEDRRSPVRHRTVDVRAQAE